MFWWKWNVLVSEQHKVERESQNLSQTKSLMAGISCTTFLQSGAHSPEFPWQFHWCARGTGHALCLSGRQLSLEASPPSAVTPLTPFLCSALFAVVSWRNRYLHHAAKGNQQRNTMTIPAPLTTSLLQEEHQFRSCSINWGQFNRKNGLYTSFLRTWPSDLLISLLMWNNTFCCICVKLFQKLPKWFSCYTTDLLWLGFLVIITPLKPSASPHHKFENLNSFRRKQYNFSAYS